MDLSVTVCHNTCHNHHPLSLVEHLLVFEKSFLILLQYTYLPTQRHTLLSSMPTDSTNNHSLSLGRYEKYMNEWILFMQLRNFLKQFQHKSSFIPLVENL